MIIRFSRSNVVSTGGAIKITGHSVSDAITVVFSIDHEVLNNCVCGSSVEHVMVPDVWDKVTSACAQAMFRLPKAFLLTYVNYLHVLARDFPEEREVPPENLVSLNENSLVEALVALEEASRTFVTKSVYGSEREIADGLDEIREKIRIIDYERKRSYSSGADSN